MRLLSTGIAVVIVIVVAVALLSSGGSSQQAKPAAAPAGGSTTSKAVAPSSSSVCPLTGAPAPDGAVPDRPALAVKVGNDPAARPQSGLSRTDIVFEVPIEGAITRFIAVFQCQGAARVGPVRSTRWIDVQLLEQLGHPIFGFAGGINPDRALVATSPLFDADFFRHYDLYYRDQSQLAPNNLYVATASLWKLDHSTTPPPALFTYSTAMPAGSGASSVGSVALTYSSIYEVTWQWEASSGRWLRFYGTTPADGASGTQLSAANVVIERVNTVPGRYVEDSEGDYGVHSITVGRGRATVLRNGVAISGYWERSSIRQRTRLVTAGGSTIDLTPGNTWVELVPNDASVTFASGTSRFGDIALRGHRASGTSRSAGPLLGARFELPAGRKAQGPSPDTETP